MTFPAQPPSATQPWAGCLITSVATFTLASTGLPADPSTIVVKVEQGGVTTTYTYPNAFITKVSVGIYSCEIDTTGQAGPGIVEWIGTGAVQAPNAVQWQTTPLPL